MHKGSMRNTLIVALMSGFLAFSGCAPQNVNSTAPNQVDGATAALVNGEAIYISDVELEATAQGRIEPDTPFGPDHPDFQPVLDQLIDQRLLAEEALRMGLDEAPAARRRLQAGRERLLGNILVENLVASEVTEAKIDEMYAEQVKLQQLDDQVRLRQILVETEEEANDVHAELVSGRDFSEAAFEYSQDTRTRLDGGSFGWVAPNEMIEPFPAKIGDTETGTYSTPFQSTEGWHILKVDERRTSPPKTKDEMRPEIITFLTFTQISDVLRDLRISADIQQRNPVTQPPPEDPTEGDPGENSPTPQE